MDQTPEAENLINWAKYKNSFWLIEDYIFANDFLRFFDRSFQKRKKSCFFEIWKNVKYVFSNTGAKQAMQDHLLLRWSVILS